MNHRMKSSSVLRIALSRDEGPKELIQHPGLRPETRPPCVARPGPGSGRTSFLEQNAALDEELRAHLFQEMLVAVEDQRDGPPRHCAAVLPEACETDH